MIGATTAVGRDIQTGEADDVNHIGTDAGGICIIEMDRATTAPIPELPVIGFRSSGLREAVVGATVPGTPTAACDDST